MTASFETKSSVCKHIHTDSLPNINHLPVPSTSLALVQNPLYKRKDTKYIQLDTWVAGWHTHGAVSATILHII